MFIHTSVLFVQVRKCMDELTGDTEIIIRGVTVCISNHHTHQQLHWNENNFVFKCYFLLTVRKVLAIWLAIERKQLDCNSQKHSDQSYCFLTVYKLHVPCKTHETFCTCLEQHAFICYLLLQSVCYEGSNYIVCWLWTVCHGSLYYYTERYGKAMPPCMTTVDNGMAALLIGAFPDVGH